MATPENLFAVLKAAIEALPNGTGNISIEWTLHTLALGAQQTSAPFQFAAGYVDSTIDFIVIESNSEPAETEVGPHSKHLIVGVTDTEVFVGDELTSPDGVDYKITSVSPQSAGDVISYFRVEAVQSSFISKTYVYPPPPLTGSHFKLDILVQTLKELELDIILDFLEPYNITSTISLEAPAFAEAAITKTATPTASETHSAHDGWVLVTDVDPYTAGTVDLGVGYTAVPDGDAQATTLTPAATYVIRYWKLDGVSQTIDPTTPNTFSVPDQADATIKRLVAYPEVGWGLSRSTNISGAPVYGYAASGSTATATATGSPDPGEHWHIWLDGVTDLGHSPAVIPAQADGSYHVVTAVSTP